MPEKTAQKDAGTPSGAQPKVKWDDTGMQTTYANVCNVASTREEVSLLFGTNQTGLTDPSLSVRLSNRIILSPFAAKRLATLINGVVKEYEQRFGELNMQPPKAGAK